VTSTVNRRPGRERLATWDAIDIARCAAERQIGGSAGGDLAFVPQVRDPRAGSRPALRRTSLGSGSRVEPRRSWVARPGEPVDLVSRRPPVILSQMEVGPRVGPARCQLSIEELQTTAMVRSASDSEV
jgi:hypothetical protein